MRTIINTKVRSLEEKSKRINSNVDKETGKVMETTINLGWFVMFEGSHESLFVGREKPTDMDPGMPAQIVIKTGKDIQWVWTTK